MHGLSHVACWVVWGQEWEDFYLFSVGLVHVQVVDGDCEEMPP